MPILFDHFVEDFNHPPAKRIISLVPSQTELLCDLGLDVEVIGITKFCIHPQKWSRTKQRIGGTKNLRLDVIAQLNPDLIIANKEENNREQIESLADNFPVYVSDVEDLPGAYRMISSVGKLAGRTEAAAGLILKITAAFELAETGKPAPSCAYLIWKDPLMVAGGDTFINDMLRRAGYRNVFAEYNRYPMISAQDLQAAAPELLFLSSEPYPFVGKHIAEMRAILPQAKVILVDGEMFSWYGSRLLQAPSYFAQLRTDLASSAVHSGHAG